MSAHSWCFPLNTCCVEKGPSAVKLKTLLNQKNSSMEQHFLRKGVSAFRNIPSITLSCFSLRTSWPFRRSTRFFMVLLGERTLASFWTSNSVRRYCNSFSNWDSWDLSSSDSLDMAFIWDACLSSSLENKTRRKSAGLRT